MLYIIFVLVGLWYLIGKYFPINWRELNCISKQLKPHEIINNQLLHYDPKIDLPEFKFYHSIIGEVLELKRRFGAPSQKAFQELRFSLIKDVKWDNKIKSLKSGAQVQYFFMCVFIWILLLHMTQTLGINLDLINVILITIWQILGAYLFRLSIALGMKKLLRPFYDVFQITYAIRSMILISRPLQEVKLKLENYQDAHPSKVLQQVNRRINHFLQLIKTEGKVQVSELDCLSSEVWNAYELAVEKFEYFLSGLKLFSFLAFIIPCYFFALSIALG